MKTHSFTRWLPHDADHLFAIVSDVDEYHRFVPLCEEARVWDVTIDGPIKRFRAELTVAYAKMNIRESFISEVVADAEKRLVVARSSEGAVKELENRWLMRPRDGGADVVFSLKFKMRSALLQLAVNAVFDKAAEKVLDAFEKRAAELVPKTA